MSNPLNWISAELQTLVDEGLFRRRREVRPLSAGRYQVDGREVWDFASNDYLGLATDTRVIEAATAAVRSHGVGGKASPLVCGRTDWHVRLEQALANFEGAEAAILFPTGMAANVGAIAALATNEDAVFSDRLNHASLIDGCRLSGAKLRIYRHDDLQGLDDALGRESARRKFIITDSVFSMDGNFAPLAELCTIGERHSAAVIVDEAHGTGVFGECGRGVVELQGLEDRVAVRVGTLSKAIGTLGGFVTGSQNLIEFLWNKSRTQIYSTSLPPAICAAATTALEIIRNEPQRRERVHQLASQFRARLIEQGVTPLANSIGPIVPIVLNTPAAALQVADRLFESGFLVGAIRPPTVPKNSSRLRITLHSEMPEETVQQLAVAIAAAVSNLG